MTGKELLAALKLHQRQNPSLLEVEIAVWAFGAQRHIDAVEIAPSFPDRPMTGELGLQIVTGAS
jgi:hypothetical protein